MVFNSLDFLLFFPIIIIIYYFLPKYIRRYVLLLSCYVFYIGLNVKYLIPLIVCTFTTWIASILLDGFNSGYFVSQTLKKAVFGICIIVNILMLAFFKYYNFGLDLIRSLFELLNVRITVTSIGVILPIGISFYTFQALSYLIEVYRNNVKAEKSFLTYSLYVAFFPTIGCGPIERPDNLLRQIQSIENISLLNYERITRGLKNMIYGYFLKMVVADRIALYVNLVFDDYVNYNSIILIVACLLYGIQIYCDFAGYSYIAIGCALVLGFELLENFNAPYFSRSVSEFWRRWHITLNTWFRDYLYIPLGGSHCSKTRHLFNIMVVFIISGMWHGANWTFVIWGALNGLFQVIENVITPFIDRINLKMCTKKKSFSYRLAQTLVTFLLIDFAWIFFRSRSLLHALGIIKRIITRWDPWTFSENGFMNAITTSGFAANEMAIVLISILFILLVDYVKYYKQVSLEIFLNNQCIWFEWGIYITLIISILIFGMYGTNYQSVDYIYFQF